MTILMRLRLGIARQSFAASNDADTPLIKKRSFEEGPYAIPIELGGEPDELGFEEEMQIHPVGSRGSSRNNMGLEDFQFVEGGTPAQFLNNQQRAAEINSMEVPPPGLVLVKPLAELSILSVGSKLRKSLSKSLKRHLAGSYTKYDGDRSSTGYPMEHINSNSGSQRIKPKKSTILTTTTTTASNKINENPKTKKITPLLPIQMKTSKQKATRNESFDSSISSTVRIDSAVQKGRERLKMSDRRSSTSASISRRNSTVNSEKSSNNDLTVIENEKKDYEEANAPRIEEQKQMVVEELMSADDARSISHSVSTLQTRRRSHSGTVNESFDKSQHSGSEAITAFSMDTPIAISLDELMDPAFKIKGPSAISLMEKSPSVSSAKSNGSQRSLSICSELNSRIMFQRGGRNRASGRSNKIVDLPLPPSHPPPLPPRKISSQPCMPKQQPKPNDDYADIDDVIFGHDHNPIYSNERALNYARNTNVDYVQICPVATKALKELSTSRGLTFKRSNSLYDILALHPNNQQKNEAEYYASFDWRTSSRAFTSSSSYLAQVMNQTRKNMRKQGSAHSSTSSLKDKNT